MMLSLYADLVGVPSTEVDRIWPMVSGWVEDAVAESANRWTAEEVRERIASRDMQLWVVVVAGDVSGVVVTEVYPSAAGKTCALPIVAGDILPNLHLLDLIKGWARSIGCERLEGLGRPGWERALKDAGWRKIMTMVEVRL